MGHVVDGGVWLRMEESTRGHDPWRALSACDCGFSSSITLEAAH